MIIQTRLKYETIIQSHFEISETGIVPTRFEISETRIIQTHFEILETGVIQTYFDIRAWLFKTNDIVSYFFVKISNVNISNTPIFFVEKM